MAAGNGSNYQGSPFMLYPKEELNDFGPTEQSILLYLMSITPDSVTKAWQLDLMRKRRLRSKLFRRVTSASRARREAHLKRLKLKQKPFSPSASTSSPRRERTPNLSSQASSSSPHRERTPNHSLQASSSSPPHKREAS